MYVCIYIYIYIIALVSHPSLHVYDGKYRHTYACAWICLYTTLNVCLCMKFEICLWMRMYVSHTFMHTYIYECVYLSMGTTLLLYICIGKYIYMYVYSMYTHKYLYRQMVLYIRIYVCTHAFTFNSENPLYRHWISHICTSSPKFLVMGVSIRRFTCVYVCACGFASVFKP